MEKELSNNTEQEEVIDRVFTVANVISFIRLLMIPAFFVEFMLGNDIIATILFGTAAFTDFIDGQIARRTHTVSKVGQLLDPAVDRLLMVFGVIGVTVVGRLPIWVVIVVSVRDLVLFLGTYFLKTRYDRRVAVIFPGKVCTTLLFVGFGGLILNTPLLEGLNLVSVSWLPGLGADPCSWGIWFVYAGLILGVYTTAYYVKRFMEELHEARAISA